MNIIVARTDGSWYTRPDTTLEREIKDFYLPDGFSLAEIHKGRWIRIIKAGKAVSEKFAERYIGPFESAGQRDGQSSVPSVGQNGISYTIYGVSEEGRCPYIDGSTYVLDRNTAYGNSPDGIGEWSRDLYNRFAKALCIVSRTMSIRIGDILILEEDTECKAEDIISVNVQKNE